MRDLQEPSDSSLEEIETIWDKTRIEKGDDEDKVLQYYVSFKHMDPLFNTWIDVSCDIALRSMDAVNAYEQGPVARAKEKNNPFLSLTVNEILSYVPRKPLDDSVRFEDDLLERRGVYPNVDYKVRVTSGLRVQDAWLPGNIRYKSTGLPAISQVSKDKFEERRKLAIVGKRASSLDSDLSVGSVFTVPDYDRYCRYFDPNLTMHQHLYDRAITDATLSYAGFFESSTGEMRELERYGYKQCFQEMDAGPAGLWYFPPTCNKLEWFLRQRVANADPNHKYSVKCSVFANPINEASTHITDQQQMDIAGAPMVPNMMHLEFHLQLNLEMGVKVKVAEIHFKVAKNRNSIYLAEFFNNLNMYGDKSPSHFKEFLFSGAPLNNVAAVFLSQLLPRVVAVSSSKPSFKRRIGLFAYTLMQGRASRYRDIETHMQRLTGYYSSLGFQRKLNTYYIDSEGSMYMDNTVENILNTINAKKNAPIQACRELLSGMTGLDELQETVDEVLEDEDEEMSDETEEEEEEEPPAASFSERLEQFGRVVRRKVKRGLGIEV